MDVVQFLLQLCNASLSVVGIYYWRRVGKNNLSLDTAVWWPIALLVNNLMYSTTSVLWLTGIIELPYPIILTYWSQAVRLQLGVTLSYGAWIMERFLKYRRDKGA